MSTWCTDSSRSSGSMPRENVRQACGSRSTSSTRWPSSASAAPSDATVVVLATPPFWLATARTWCLDAAGPFCPRPCCGSAAPSVNAGRHVATHRPDHRSHRRDRPVLRPPARRSRARPGAGRARPRAAGGARRGAAARRTASRPRCSSPTSPTGTQLAARRGAARRPDAAGRPAGEQRRLRAQAARSWTTPSRTSSTSSTCWSPPCSGSPTPRSARWWRAAAARSSTSPASPATCPAAPTAPPRPTSPR